VLKQIATDVYLYEDSCNVYLLKSGNKGLLIDIGSGAVLEHLRYAGVAQVDMALLTHAHRDQCFGMPAVIGHGAEIVAPQKEKPYLNKEEVRQFWNRHFPLVNSVTYYSVLSSGYEEVQCRLAAGDVIEWGGFRLEAIDAAGHTPGQLAYLLRHPDGDVLFCGDAACEGGKLWKGYSLEWHHCDPTGAEAACQTLVQLIRLAPQRLAPSHGSIVHGDVAGQLTLALEDLRSYKICTSFENYHIHTGGRLISPRVPVLSTVKIGHFTAWRLSERLWNQDNTYFLLSSNNRCLVVDCGYGYYQNFIPEFLEYLGCSGVDVVIPTHAHNDHVEYMPFLKNRYGAEIWALEHLCDVVEAPERYWQPFSRWANMTVDRKLQDRSEIAWNEYNLKFHWYPGQTAFGSAIETVVDGKHVLFTGDNFFPVDQWAGTGGIMGLNRGLPAGHTYSAERTLEIAPEWLLTGHAYPFLYDADEFQSRANWGREALRRMQKLAPPGSDWRIHFDPHYLSAYPFMQTVKRGERLMVWLVGESPESVHAAEEQWIWALPDGFAAEPAQDRQFDTHLLDHLHRLRFTSRSLYTRPFEIAIPPDADPGTFAIYVNDRRNAAIEAMFLTRVI